MPKRYKKAKNQKQISNQRAYQERHKKLGLCHLCSEKAIANSSHCKKHLEAQRLRGRKAIGYKGEKTKTPLT